jgi:ribosome-associated protein
MIATDMSEPSISPSDEIDDTPETPSKSQRKRDMAELEDMGEALTGLSEDRIKRMDLPEDLRVAVLEAKRIKSHGARRRQLKYIGKVMRQIDPAPIRAQLDALEGTSRAQTAWTHKIEHWRHRLLSDDAALNALVAEYPDANHPQLRTLIENSQREKALGRIPRSYREIFQVLRKLIPQPAGGPVAGRRPDDADIDDEDEENP